MSDCVYVVMGETGSYSDYENWLVGFSDTKKVAEAAATSLNALAKQRGAEADARLKRRDPNAVRAWASENIFYAVLEVEILIEAEWRGVGADGEVL